MIKTIRQPAFWYCLTMALAIAMAAIGTISLLDYLISDLGTLERVSLLPSVSLTVIGLGALMMTSLLRYTLLSRAIALGLAGLVVSLSVNPVSDNLWSQPFQLHPVLASVTLITIFAVFVGQNGNVRPKWVYAAGLTVLGIGALSLAARWFTGLHVFDPGRSPEAGVVLSPLVMILGLVITTFPRILQSELRPYARGLMWMGILGILLTVLSWHATRLQYSSELLEEAEGLANRMATDSASAFDGKLALLRRMAERWQALGKLPPESLRKQEFGSYLRDIPEFMQITLLDSQLHPSLILVRDPVDRDWLRRFIELGTSREWLAHVLASKAPHLSAPLDDKAGQSLAAIAAPVTLSSHRTYLILAGLNLAAIYQDLSRHYHGPLELKIFQSGTKVFDTAPDIPAVEEAILTTRQVEAGHNRDLRIDIYLSLEPLPAGELYLPPFILFTGLGLSFLVMLTHFFWRQSEDRSHSLSSLNETLNHHLSEERELRYVNNRIMEFSRDILCSVGQDGRILGINPACFQVLGYRPEELRGQHYHFVVLPEDRATIDDQLAWLSSDHQSRSSEFKTRLRHRDGHTVTVSWTSEWSKKDRALFCVGRDISANLVAETLTRERDQFFALSPDMFCIVDLNSHFFEVNQSFVKTLGYTREELLGTSYMALIHPDDSNRVTDAVQSLIDGQEVHDLYIRVIDRQQAEHWLQINAILSADDLIYVVARDITEALETQEKLQQSEALLKIAERTASLGGWIIHLPERKVTWTDVIFDIHELPRGEVPSLEEALSFYTPDSRDTITAALETCIAQGIPFDEELRIRTATGSLRWVRAIGHAFRREDGTVSHIQGAFQDITQSREAMEQIRRFAERQATIFESITDAFFTVDREWRFTYVNQKSEELLHCSRHQLLGHSLWDLFPAAVGSDFEKHYRHAAETGESVSFEAYYEPLNNWLEVSAYPSDEGLAVYYRSIRERKEAQWKLESAMAELERSNRELQDFAFVASHDLQEPLRKIQAFSDRLMIKSDQFAEREQDYLQRMQSAAHRMQSLIEDLLKYSRVTTRARPLELCDTNALLEEVLGDLETAISSSGAVIHRQSLPSVTGDRTQLRQVFQNLLSNAIKFHRPGVEPEIEIASEKVSDGQWTLVVRDNGIGFDPRYSEKVFHPFQRLHARQGYSGTGIGMAIVKKILDRHGASITVDSREGEGSTFRIVFTIETPARGESND